MIAALGFTARSYAQDEVLAPGRPPLTKTMVDQRIWVLEKFLDIHLTPEERDRFTQATADAWKRRDKDIIQFTLNDLKLYGKESDIKVIQAQNEEQYVDKMRADPNEPLNAVLLEAYNAAHPDRKPVMQARGLGDLVGKWERGDGMAPQLNPITHQPMGISFTDALVLNIFTDGHFKHLWSHSHCTGGACCTQIGTGADGTVDAEGSKLTLKAESGTIFSRSACVAGMNKAEAMKPVTQTFEYSVHMDKSKNVPVLCLSDRPFQLDTKQGPQPFCYIKQP
jgi:hypothetical protein